MLAWYRQLITLRRRLSPLTDPHLDDVYVDVDEEAQHLVLRRGRVLVACNLGTTAWPLLADPGTELAAVSDQSITWDQFGVTLPPDSAAILVQPDWP